MNRNLYCNTAAYRLYLDIRSFFMEMVYYKLVSPQSEISKIFLRKFGRPMNWENPVDLNEKIQWLKLNTDTSTWTDLSDKYKVREFVKAKGLEDILVDLYGKWDNADDIDFNQLPNSFVLKSNHGSGDIIIVNDKSIINSREIKKTLKRALNEKFGYKFVEPHYLSIKPCLIAEELLPIDNPEISSSLIDYKIWCFHGEPVSIFVCSNRHKHGADMSVFDTKWNPIENALNYNNHFKKSAIAIPKPKNLERMLEIARTLSDGFHQVRVDLYESRDKVYFGEMTFTSNGGFMDYFTPEYLVDLGNYVKLTKDER